MEPKSNPISDLIRPRPTTHLPGNGNGENFSLRDVLQRGRKLNFKERTAFLSNWIGDLVQRNEAMWGARRVISPADREVEVIDPLTGQPKKMLMFGSNNYLGFANHPYVRERVLEAVRTYGAGIGGPPLLNGYTGLQRQLEERLSAFKKTEETLLFGSGYHANVGAVSGLVNENDTVLFDEYSHASFFDGLKLSGVLWMSFHHNDVDQLAGLLEKYGPENMGDVFVGVEGIYSMDGDLAPLDRIVPLCKRHNAILMVDDAHGTGVLGEHGHGISEHFGVETEVDINIGTFSKAFGVAGGFVSASKPIVDYLRFFARSYMFSSSLPPAVTAAVLAGLDLLEQEPAIVRQLRENVQYTAAGLRRLGFDTNPEGAIIPIRVPKEMNIRKAGYQFHKAGIFLNSIEYPAVPVHLQRFRISIMATHTREDLDRLLECVEQVWATAAQTADAPLAPAGL